MSHGLASFMALVGSVPVVAEVELDLSDVSGPPPPDTQNSHTVLLLMISSVGFPEGITVIVSNNNEWMRVQLS